MLTFNAERALSTEKPSERIKDYTVATPLCPGNFWYTFKNLIKSRISRYGRYFQPNE